MDNKEKERDFQFGKALLYIGKNYPQKIGELGISIARRSIKESNIELSYKEVAIFYYGSFYDPIYKSSCWHITLSPHIKEKIRNLIYREYCRQYQINTEKDRRFALEQGLIREQQLSELNAYLEEL
jgi:hypothetical protein